MKLELQVLQHPLLYLGKHSSVLRTQAFLGIRLLTFIKDSNIYSFQSSADSRDAVTFSGYSLQNSESASLVISNYRDKDIRYDTWPPYNMAVKFARRYAQVILFGDSITQFGFSPSENGWCAILANHFQRRIDFINRGLSGYTTRWAKTILPQIVHTENRPDLIVLFFGANDAATNALQHVPIDEYATNLSDMCSYLNTVGVNNSSILLVTQPPVCDADWEKSIGLTGERSYKIAEQYATRVIELGQTRGISVVDVFHGIAGKGDLSNYLSDGLHLSEEGNEVVGEMMVDALEEKFQGQNSVFPGFEEMADKNVLKQLSSKI